MLNLLFQGKKKVVLYRKLLLIYHFLLILKKNQTFFQGQSVSHTVLQLFASACEVANYLFAVCKTYS